LITAERARAETSKGTIMSISTRTIAGATASLGLLLAFTACGNETVTDADPGNQPAAQARIYPPTSIPVYTPGSRKGPLSADAADRRAAADKERQDRASTLRWARGGQQENKLERAGLPGQP
jgi:hypothetical protein